MEEILELLRKIPKEKYTEVVAELIALQNALILQQQEAEFAETCSK